MHKSHKLLLPLQMETFKAILQKWSTKSTNSNYNNKENKTYLTNQFSYHHKQKERPPIEQHQGVHVKEQRGLGGREEFKFNILMSCLLQH